MMKSRNKNHVNIVARGTLNPLQLPDYISLTTLMNKSLLTKTLLVGNSVELSDLLRLFPEY